MATQTTTHQHFPGLDGLRALPLLLILAFHADLGWVPGGFIAVSVFFALSGYLITGNLLRELDTHGRIRLRQFWAKRARRLVPAAVLCFAGVSLWAIFSDSAQTGPGLMWDVVAAFGNVSNWRFALTGRTYADLFAGPSPLLHTWSLSIEEQFYFLYPLLLVLLWRLGLRRRGCTLVFAGLTIGSFLAAYAAASDELSYYGTPARCGEILAGCVLALLTHGRMTQWNPAAGSRGPRFVTAAALLTTGAIMWISFVAQPNEPALLKGGLTVVGVASLSLVVASVVPGPLRWFLSLEPLPTIGRWSYGIYLFHWPVFLWIKNTSVGGLGVRTFLLQVGVTVALAGLSYTFVEQPIRKMRWPQRGGRGRFAYLASFAAVGLLAVSVPTATASTSALGQAQAGPPTVVEITVPTSTIPAPPATPETSTPETSTPETSTPETSTTETSTPETSRTEKPTSEARESVSFRLLVLGSDAGLAGRLRSALAEHDIEVIDRATRTCGAISTDLCPRRRWEQIVAAIDPDAVVAGLSDIERLPYRLAEGTLVGSDQAGVQLRRAGLAEMIGFLDSLDVPAFVVDSLAAQPDRVSQMVRALANRSSVIALGSTNLGDVADHVGASPAADARALRVLVVGDSTAFALAQGLALGAQGGLEVISAGVIRCPLVRAVRTRGSPTEEGDTKDCLWYDTDWARLVRAYRADLILGVVSLSEQWDQQYSGVDGWHAPGSAEYVAFHQSEAEAIAATVASIGVPLLLADAPPLSGDIGGYFGTEPERIAAWNAEIDRLDAASAGIVRIPYAQWFSDPTSAAGDAERPDGVHVTDEFSEQLTRDHLLEAIQAGYRQAQRDLRQQD